MAKLLIDIPDGKHCFDCLLLDEIVLNHNVIHVCRLFDKQLKYSHKLYAILKCNECKNEAIK